MAEPVTDETITPDLLIQLLGMEPHPEGGCFVETWRDQPADGSRGTGTAIYYLLRAGESSHWHRVTDATEIWHWYAGAPLVLSVSSDGQDAQAVHLGPDITVGQRPQFVIPANWWQAAESLGAWTLCGCTVSPAFSFGGFEMAPPGWHPAPRGT